MCFVHDSYFIFPYEESSRTFCRTDLQHLTNKANYRLPSALKSLTIVHLCYIGVVRVAWESKAGVKAISRIQPFFHDLNVFDYYKDNQQPILTFVRDSWWLSYIHSTCKCTKSSLNFKMSCVYFLCVYFNFSVIILFKQ